MYTAPIDVKDLRLRYWTSFSEYIRHQPTRLRAHKPNNGQFYVFHLDKDDWHLDVYLHVSEGKISVHLIKLHDPEDRYFNVLKGMRQEIEKELGFPLSWENNHGQESHLVIEKALDPKIEENWPAMHAWSLDICERMDSVFRPRIQEIGTL